MPQGVSHNQAYKFDQCATAGGIADVIQIKRGSTTFPSRCHRVPNATLNFKPVVG